MYINQRKIIIQKFKLTISNLKFENKVRIQKELLKLFIFTRVTVIQKNNFFWNIFNIPRYILDLVIFEIRYSKNISIFSLFNNIYVLIKSIYRSRFI